MPVNTPAQFDFDDLLRLYQEWDRNDAGRPYEHISEILERAKAMHKAAHQIKTNGNGDHGQSWRAWKGKNFEKLIRVIVEEEIAHLNRAHGLTLAAAHDTALERARLSVELDRVKRNLLVDYGSYGSHLPDADLIIYDRISTQVLCILSCKVTMRERIAQTAYWKLKLRKSAVTRHVRVALVTPDEDEDLIIRPEQGRVKKNYAIASVDLDTTYVLHTALQPTDRIKSFSRFAHDIKSWTRGGGVDARRPPQPGKEACRAVSARARCAKGIAPRRQKRRIALC